MLTEKDYCDYETCVALIEMGVVGTSRYYYDKKNHKLHITNYGIIYTVRTASASDYVLAIHLYDAAKWLREEKKIHIEPYLISILNGHPEFKWLITNEKQPFFIHNSTNSKDRYNSYEKTLNEGIKEAIKLLKEEK